MNTSTSSNLLTTIALLICCLLIASCTTVGTGQQILIRSHVSDADLQARFPYLLDKNENLANRIHIVKHDNQELYPQVDSKQAKDWAKQYSRYMIAKYGSPDFESVELSVSYRDVGKLPPLAPAITTLLRQELVKILSDPKLSKDEKLLRRQELTALLQNAPELAHATTLNGTDGMGHEIYHYFPRLEVNFSSDLYSNSTLDRLSQLIMYLRLPDDAIKKGVRIVDFSPKDADIVEFTRGSFKQSTALAAKASAGKTSAVETTTVSGDKTIVDNSGTSLGGEVSFTATEEYTRQLKDALEKRTTGIVDDGRAVLLQLRAQREVRIGGTYYLDLMLEIPSKPSPTSAAPKKYYQLDPVVNEIRPKVLLIGVVRHVFDRGLTGSFNKVPEIENDDVFEQIVTTIQDTPLWTFNNERWIRSYEPDPPAIDHVIHVVTNDLSARFVIEDSKGEIIGQGKGFESKAVVSGLAANTMATIRFLPILDLAGKSGKVVATPSLTQHSFRIVTKKAGTSSYVIIYQ